MDINTLKEKRICIDDSSRAHKKKYTTFFLLNPDGIVDSVAGLENLAFSFEGNSYKNARCYKCLSVFSCESTAVYRTCPKCHIVNALVPHDSIGRKVLILICYQCNSRNLTNIDCSYVQCFLCSRVNLSQYDSANLAPSQGAHDSPQRKQKKNHRGPIANMFKCLRLRKNRRERAPSSGDSDRECFEESCEESCEGSCEESRSGEAARSEVQDGSMQNNVSFENVRENDKEEDPNGQRTNKKLFSEEKTHGYTPEGKYSNEDYRKKYSQSNNSGYNTSMNYMPYSNDKFQTGYMRNSSNNYGQMGYMKKGSNESGNYYPSGSHSNGRIGNPSSGYPREHSSFHNSKYDKNYQYSYSHNNTHGSSWNKDSRVHESNNHDMHRSENYNYKLGTIVESGNVKRKTLMFNNVNDSSVKKVHKTISFLEMERKRDSDVRACIEYFNSLRRSKNDDIKMILENQNFKELNIPKEHLENRHFYRYVEYYKKHNLKNLIDQFNESSANHRNKSKDSGEKGKDSASSISNGINKDKATQSGSSNGNDKGKNGARDPSGNEKNTSSKSTDSKTKKAKLSEIDSLDDHSHGDGNAYHKNKKSKCEENIKPTFYTIDDLFE
ncbi:hypothetical protein C922_00626 [Plasmodium inui San Antonio 1]|uniref:Uncharacterized protein n=1 Tax=Plasmodium inui San Antonio 1 TaxID=1237626 RepID=W7AB24_9APIC|nr:hypothetical protein C922_00626 [Plasmodium inui San Antonio 1]EUD68935.1 hypothetical protein C922_00626 [Plasmodium inui San Antonio 1]